MADWEIGLSVISLIALNAYQTFFWSRANRELIDRLMARNYSEFVQGKKLLSEKPQEKPVEDEQESQEARDYLAEIHNRIPTI